MHEYEVGKIFTEITAPIEIEQHQRQTEAFTPESRPIPEGLINNRITLGHIAFMGDFTHQPVNIEPQQNTPK